MKNCRFFIKEEKRHLLSRGINDEQEDEIRPSL